MARPPKFLGAGEDLILATRTHWKALILPALVLIVTCGIAGFLVAIVPADWEQREIVWLVIGAVALGIIAVFSLWKFLVWFYATYVITDRRLVTRNGVINRKGLDIPLARINNVSSDRGLVDRMLGCGTLIIESAGESGRVTLPDVPKVEDVQRRLSVILFDDEGERWRGEARRQ